MLGVRGTARTLVSARVLRVSAESPSRFAELHCISNFSFLRGGSHPEELVHTASELGYEAIAITDECSMAGAVKAHMAAKECSIKLIAGAEFHLPDADGRDCHLVFLAPTRAAYGQLCTLITKARRRAEKGSYRLQLDDLSWGVGQCFALWVPAAGTDIGTLIAQGAALKAHLKHLWIALELFREADDLDKTANALTLSMRLDLPLVAANDVHLHIKERLLLQHTLTAIRLKRPVAELGSDAAANAERRLRTLEELATLYPVELLQESADIAERCRFSLDELRYEYPEELVPPHLTPATYLRQLTYAGAAERWPDGVPSDTIELIERELELVSELDYEYYFLTVHDIVQFARSQGILCQGRGSAANSAVCYCLHITEVDPSRMHLLFERFVSKERDEPPDIDVDFEHERREEVIQYLYKRYSRERAALAATLITYRPRSAVRDVGKALGLDLDLVDLLAKSLAWWENREVLSERLQAAGMDPDGRSARQFIYLLNEILGFPRHLSQHVGGFVISRGPLAQLVPVENAAMEDRTIIQWDKDDLEALGLLKVDVLGLGMLTAIRKALACINVYRDAEHPLTVQGIPAEDPDTYRMLQQGDSVGVFQVESRAQMAMLPRLRPQNFYDLVIEVAIVRPGPIQGDMVHPYLRRRQGIEDVTYPSEGVRKVLERTLGVPIFQEQVIELAMVAAGFTAGEADQLRRAMAAWKRRGGLAHFEQKLIDGMRERGHDQAFAERVFRQILGFGEYGFPESHAASFALLVYLSAWLKRHEPAAFYCGLLNSLPMGFYSPSQLIQDARRHDIAVAPVDVQSSTWDHSMPQARGCLRLGLRIVKGLNEDAGQRVAAAQPFSDIDDLMHRARLDKASLGFLARAGALETLTGHRHQAHWDVAGLAAPTALQEVADARTPYHTDVQLTPPASGDDVLADYRYLGLSLGPHPLALLRSEGVLPNCRTAEMLEQYRQGQFVQVAGLVTGRQRPGTATGVMFVTLEDETGNVNVVVWSSAVERFRAAVLQGQLLHIKGIVEREAEVIHVVAGHIDDISHLLGRLSDTSAPDVTQPSTHPFRSRDFH